MSTHPLDARSPRTRHPLRHLRVLVVLLAAVAGAALATARGADAAPFPFAETFRNATAPDFALGGTPGSPAALTAGAGDATGDGWLRLTPAVTNRFGYAYHRTAFPSANGLVFDFDYAAWGGAGNGADGLAFVLFDGATSDAQFHPGPAGGALGYTACDTQPGLSNAYMGIGFDEFGNFANSGICQQSGASNGIVPNRVTVRGGAPAYQHLSSVIATGGVAASRANARHVTVTVLPKNGATVVSVAIRYPNGTVQPIATDLPLATPPETLKFGFTASTGGSVNNHEIRNLQVTKPTDLRVEVDAEPTSTDRNGVQEYVARVTNAGPNPTTAVDVTTSAPHTTDAAWTCTGAGGASCPAASGAGFPQGDVGPLPVGGELTFRITSRLTDDADDSSLTFEAQPTGDTSELVPADNAAEARSDVTPGIALPPTLTLAESGLATATSGSASGGNLTRVLQWLRCAADGGDCLPIAGATGPGYQTTVADGGAALRVRETVTNAAGAATAFSVALTVPGPAPEPTPAPLADVEALGPDGAPTDDAGPELADPHAPGSLLPSAIDVGHGPADALLPAGSAHPASPSTAGGAVAVPPLAPLALPSTPLPAPAPLVAPAPAGARLRTTAAAAPRAVKVPTTKPFRIARGVVAGPVRRTLADVVPQLRRAKTVRCVGVTDRRGSAARSRRLALRQARAVCRTLRQLGVRAKLRSSARRAAKPRTTSASATRPKQDRRVELVPRY
ncbi:MAG: hypothetical protein ITG02_06275 [Patulibacter sp.]|nr:hypothetical protein [Patulibacter sp.]